MPLMGLFGMVAALLIGMLAFTALVPLLLVILALAAFGAADWQAWRPDVLWARLTDSRVKRNAALLNGTLAVLHSRGVPAVKGLPESEGFLLEGPLSSSALWDAAFEALYRLRRGEENLAYGMPSRHGVALGTIGLTVLFLSVLALSGKLSLMTTLLCVVAARAVAPVVTPWVQRHLITDSDLRGLQLQGISERSMSRSALGGRIAWRSEGLFVATSFEGTPVEVEIIE